MNKKKVLITINPDSHKRGVKLSKKEFKKPNFSKYVEHLINKENEN